MSLAILASRSSTDSWPSDATSAAAGRWKARYGAGGAGAGRACRGSWQGGHAGAGESAIDCLLQLGAGVDLMSPIIAEDACGLQLCSLLPLSISALPASPTPSPLFHEPF